MDNYMRFLWPQSKFLYPYQIISYCLRPFAEKEWENSFIIQDNILSNLTFDELKTMNISGQDLISWSAPVDLVENYESYLNGFKPFGALDRFYNCTPLWFGTFCQFTFNSNQLFTKIVKETFTAKHAARIYDYENPRIRSNLDITNLTCYIHIKCNRGLLPMCLDWREVCDGRIDCLGNTNSVTHTVAPGPLALRLFSLQCHLILAYAFF